MNPFLFRRFRNLETRVHELNYIFWECTLRCNLSCRHCGSDCFSSSLTPDMPLPDFLKALDTVPRSLNNTSNRIIVVLTGGEPLLRPDILEVGEAIKQRGFYWSMVSNGFLYTEEMHKKLMDAGLKALTISLDGTEENHNWMRGNPQSFNKALNAIKIAAADKRLDFDVVTCVNKRNVKRLEELYSLLSGVGVKKWRLFTIIPIGRAKKEEDLHLTKSEKVELMEFIKNYREKNKKSTDSRMDVSFSCEGYLGKYEEKVRPVRFFCHAGINIASVLIDGRISACPNVDRDLFSQGNIYRDNFYDVWENRFKPFRDRSWAKQGICKECKHFKDCLGGGMHNWKGTDGSNTLRPLTCNCITD